MGAGTSLSSGTTVVPPAPSQTSVKQSPTFGSCTGVPAGVTLEVGDEIIEPVSSAP